MLVEGRRVARDTKSGGGVCVCMIDGSSCRREKASKGEGGPVDRTTLAVGEQVRRGVYY